MNKIYQQILKMMETQQVIVLAVLVILVSVAIPYLSKASDSPNPQGIKVPDTIFSPSSTYLDSNKIQIVQDFIKNTKNGCGVIFPNYQLDQCQNQTQLLKGQLAGNQSECRDNIGGLETSIKKCVDDAQANASIWKVKQDSLKSTIQNNVKIIQDKDAAISALEKKLQQCENQPCQPGICPPCPIKICLDSLKNCQQQLSTTKQEVQQKTKALQDVRTASVTTLKNQVEELKNQFQEEGEKRHPKIDELIQKAQEQLKKDENSVGIVNVFGTIVDGISDELEETEKELDQTTETLEQGCYPSYQKAMKKLLECEEAIKPYLKA